MKVDGSIEFTVIERGDDRVVSEMPIHSGMLNPFGVIHAEAMLWLADVTATGERIRTMPRTKAGLQLCLSLTRVYLCSRFLISSKASATFARWRSFSSG
jgi:ABC-type phosphonate transport system ATPase subunit